MNISIHPYLIARFIAVQQAFMANGITAPRPLSPKPTSNNGNGSLNGDDDDEGSGGGGGTIRGNRGKNAVHAAKEAMRKLSRGRASR